MKLPAFAAVAMLSVSLHTQAASVEVALSEDNAKFSLNSYIGGMADGRATMSAGYFYNEDHVDILNLGLHIVDVVGSTTPGLQVGVGVQGYFSDISSHEGAALGLGAIISYRAPQLKRVNFVAHGHYAPGITSYMDTERFSEYGIAIEYSLLPQADIFIGYRDIKVEEEFREFSIDDSGHLGLRISF